MARVKKNDTVVVLAGKYKGKKGLVMALSLKHDKVLVQGVAIATRHAKAKRQGETSGIKKEETFIALSNVMPICGSCKTPCRVNSKVVEQGGRSRVCNNCKEIF